MRYLIRVVLMLLMGVGCMVGMKGEGVKAENVLVVVAKGNDGSEEVGEYYVRRRGIPKGNVVYLEVGNKEEVKWGEFVREIYNPLRRKLVEGGWVEGRFLGRVDELGREEWEVSGNKIGGVVLCYGIPIKIAHVEEGLDEFPEDLKEEDYHLTSASVDSELAGMFLVREGEGIAGPVKNPLYSGEKGEVLRVFRLDGGSIEGIKKGIEGGLIVEERGLRGLCYMEVDGEGGAEEEIRKSGVGVVRPKGGRYEVLEDRWDGVGVVMVDGRNRVSEYWRGVGYVPGAIGMVRDGSGLGSLKGKGWGGVMTRGGMSVVCGEVYKTEGKDGWRWEKMVKQLRGGEALGDVAYRAMPVLSWNGVIIGDPLYRPFKVGLIEQVKRVEGRDRYEEYTVMNLMKWIEWRGKGKEEALRRGVGFFKVIGGMGLGYEVLKLGVELGDREAVGMVMKFLERVMRYDKEDEVVGVQIGRLLVKYGYKREGLMVYEEIMEKGEMDRRIKKKVEEEKGILEQEIGDL